MPIYAYKCSACGHVKDVLQKISDAPLTSCPSCGQNAFSKQLSAPGFQLKGSGWYATDFKGGSAAAVPATDAKTTETQTSEPAASPAGDAAPSTPAACGTGCGCH